MSSNNPLTVEVTRGDMVESRHMGACVVVDAMIRGARLVVKGTSSRGTKTTDTYSLKGFSAAFKAIGKACKVK